jgi:hypothetical protein
MYAITATVETVKIGSGDTEWHGSVQVPTFYLDENVQGIIHEAHAASIARRVIDPLDVIPADRIHITAVRV